MYFDRKFAIEYKKVVTGWLLVPDRYWCGRYWHEKRPTFFRMIGQFSITNLTLLRVQQVRADWVVFIDFGSRFTGHWIVCSSDIGFVSDLIVSTF